MFVKMDTMEIILPTHAYLAILYVLRVLVHQIINAHLVLVIFIINKLHLYALLAAKLDIGKIL